jgi:CheY-like chemotaxis protein
VLLDNRHAGNDGYEVARRLRAVPYFDRTVLVAVTGFGRDEDRMRAAEVGLIVARPSLSVPTSFKTF